MNSRAINPVKMSFVNFVKCFTNMDPWNAATTSDTTINQIPTHTRHAKKSMSLPFERRNIKVQMLFFHEKKIWTDNDISEIIAESFYNVKYGLSIIMSKVLSKIISNENIKTCIYFQKNSLFWHFNSHFVLKTTETPVFMFSLLRLFKEGSRMEGTLDFDSVNLGANF